MTRLDDIMMTKDFNLTGVELEMFENYKELLQEWNEKIDITNIIDDEDVYVKHFLDSLMIFDSELIDDYMKVIDIGTGGGFPGLPMKIFNETLEVTLLDSLNKRITFLNELIDQLSLEDVEAVHARAEELSRKKEYREVYDIATSRAVANLRTLTEYCLPFVKVGGYFIAMKGPDPHQEVKEAQNSINKLGGRLVKVMEFNLPVENSGRSLVIIQKTSRTDKKYPRGQGKPRSKPL